MGGGLTASGTSVFRARKCGPEGGSEAERQGDLAFASGTCRALLEGLSVLQTGHITGCL